MSTSPPGQWNLSFGTDALSFGAPAPADPADLLVAAEGRAIPVDDGRLHWFAEGAPAPVPVNPDEAMLLQDCGHFATVDEHAGRLSRQLGAPMQAVRQILAGLAGRGVLRSVRQNLPPSTPRHADAPAPTLVIRTCRRPASLQALLDGLVAEHQRFGGDAPVFIIDDSADPQAEADTRARADAFARATGRPVGVLDGASREHWRPIGLDLVPAADQPMLDALLSPERAPAPVPGRAFNWALLLGAGGPVSILDDDFLLPLKRFANAGKDVEIRHSTAYLAEFPDPGEDPRLVDVIDPIHAEACRLIGQPAAALLASPGFRADALAGSRPAELDWLRADTRVRAVIQGTYGSFGVASVLPVCGPGQRTLANLLRPPFRMQRLQADPIHYGLERTRLAAQAVSLPWLIDATSLVPPTNAAGVAEDTLFAALLRAIDPTACFAYVPSLIGHRQDGHRDRITASLQPIAFGANHFLAQQVVARGAATGTDAASRSQSLADWLGELAQSSDARLDMLAVRWWNEERASACASLTQSLAQNPGAPAEWRSFVQAMRSANQAVVGSLDTVSRQTLRAAIAQSRVALAVWPRLFGHFAGLPMDRRLAA